MQPRHVLVGLVFGFVLVRAGATDYDAIAGMFRLTDLHLIGVIGTAIAVNAAGFAVLRRRGARARTTGEPLAFTRKPIQRGLVTGGLLFGAGWAVAGTCPGTALAQIGSGQLAGLFTFAGIVGGAWLHQRASARAPRRRGASSGERGCARAQEAVA